MKTGIDPRVDYAFKRVFGSEANVAVLSDLLHAVLKPARRIVELKLLNPFNEKDFEDDKLSILDIKARDETGQQYNVEMQLFGSHVLLHRLLYYWAVLHSEHLREGQKYTELQPTISIAIVNHVLFSEATEYHLSFDLRCVARPELVFSPQLSIHLLELPKFTKNADELNEPLDAWCYFLTHGAELDATNLPTGMQTKAVSQAMEVLNMLSQSDIERERYQARLKWERDQTAFIDEAHELGIEKGLQKGLEAGEWIGQIHSFQKILKLPLTPRSELHAMPIDSLREQAEALEKQLGALQE